MNDRTAIQDWDYLSVSNIVPLPPDVSPVVAPCGLCGTATRFDGRGALFTGPRTCEILCDACGDREAPALMALVRRLRAGAIYTVTATGARIDEDALAWSCPVCHQERPDAPKGWHVVDV